MNIHYVWCSNFTLVLLTVYQTPNELVGATAAPVTTPTTPQEDAKEILPAHPYHWKDWCLVRGRDCLYLWCDFVALELSNGSNGWFRFILDGKLATMYSSGSPEGGTDSTGMPMFRVNLCPLS